MRVGAFFTRIFLNDGLLRALPVLTLGTGLVVFVAAFAFFPDPNDIWHDFLKSSGQTILVGGLVGVLTNSLKYIGIFREAVHDVVYSHDHLQSRSDLIAIWGRVTSVLCQEKFPQLAPRLEADVLKNYLPTKKDFYYSNYSRECEISVADATANVVAIYEEIDFTLHPASRNAEVNYTYNSRTDSRTPPDIARLVVHSLSIDGVPQKIALTDREYDDEFGGKGLIQSYAIPLKGRDSYRIRRSATRNLCITKDPIVEFSSDEFILGCKAKFRSTDPAIIPVFQSVGTEDFDDRTMGPLGKWQVNREFDGLLFPEQGYILFIQRQA